MRGNPIVEIIAILIMLASVLVGGGYWLINKQEKSIEVLQLPGRNSNMNNSFESLHKRTE